jgi:signal transduction histidine kinase
MRRQVEEYIREARQSIWNLRSSALAERDLPTAVRALCGERAAENGIAFEFTPSGEPRRLPQRVEEQILRISVEAVLNAVRHSGARAIRVALAYHDDHVHLRVSDDGCGFDRDEVLGRGNGHLGLLSMRERAESVGGALSIHSVRGEGTHVDATIPVTG